MIRIVLPAHLRNLSNASEEIKLEVSGKLTVASLLDALEHQYPMLKGTIREHQSKERRAYIRFFACEEDFSLQPPETALPDDVADGKEPFYIIGAISGGSSLKGNIFF